MTSDDKLFAVTALNEEALAKTHRIAEAFTTLLGTLNEICPPGREMALVKTKLEEACFFARKALALDPANQPGALPSAPVDDAQKRLGVALANARIAFDALDTERALHEATKQAGVRVYREMLDAYGWINFEASHPGAGLCICFHIDEIPYDVNTVQPPAQHGALCVKFREAVAAWKKVGEGR